MSTGLRDAQIAGKALLLGVSICVSVSRKDKHLINQLSKGDLLSPK